MHILGQELRAATTTASGHRVLQCEPWPCVKSAPASVQCAYRLRLASRACERASAGARDVERPWRTRRLAVAAFEPFLRRWMPCGNPVRQGVDQADAAG